MAKKGAFGEIEIGSTPSVIGQVRRVSMPQTAAEIDVTVMGSGQAAMLPGPVRASFEVDVFTEEGDAGQEFILSNLASDTAQPVKYRPLGAGSGNPEWTGSCYIMGADTEQSVDGAVEMSITLSSDGTPFAKATLP